VFPKDPIRIVLIGDQGQGKSFVANFILDDTADPLQGPFRSERAQNAITSVPMSAKYGEKKEIRALLENGVTTWLDWESEIEPLLNTQCASALDAVKYIYEEGGSNVKITNLELKWPSTILRRYNLEVIDVRSPIHPF
jgi:hypothetical protein